MILRQIIDLYSLIVLGAVVVSWMQLPPSNPLAQFVQFYVHNPRGLEAHRS